MKKVAYIFYGKPGSGKGVQSKKLLSYLEEKGERVFIMGMGDKLREIIKSESSENHTGYVKEKIKEYILRGDLLPASIPVSLWMHFFTKNSEEDNTFIFDGGSRRKGESTMMIEMIEFLSYKPVAIVIDVKDEIVKERLMKRGRKDDATEQIIQNRLDEFNKKTVLAINEFKDKIGEVYVIDGNPDIEQVSKNMFHTLSENNLL